MHNPAAKIAENVPHVLKYIKANPNLTGYKSLFPYNTDNSTKPKIIMLKELLTTPY